MAVKLTDAEAAKLRNSIKVLRNTAVALASAVAPEFKDIIRGYIEMGDNALSTLDQATKKGGGD